MNGVDPKILGKIILLQSTIHVMQDDSAMGRFACRGLASIPGIEIIGLYIRGKYISEYENDKFKDRICEKLFEILINKPQNPNKQEKLLEDIHKEHGIECLKIETILDLYGFIILKITKEEIYKQYKPYIENTLNLIALSVENNLQKDLLLQNKAKLEQIVDERTIELERTVKELQTEVQNHQKTLSRLRKSEAQYHDLYDNAPDMFVSVDAKTALVLRCNSTTAKKLGYRKDELVGRPIFNLYHDDCMEEAKNAFRTFAEKGVVHDTELQLKRKDGNKVDVSLNTVSVRDKDNNILSSRSSWRDITDRKRAEEAQKKSEEIYKEFVEGTNDLITRVDKDGTFTFVNHISTKIFGLSPQDCIGMSAFDFIHPDDRELARNWFEDIITSQKLSGTMRTVRLAEREKFTICFGIVISTMIMMVTS